MAKPFVSKAQMERSRKLVQQGVITQEQFDESLKATPEPDKLPERIHPKKDESEQAK